jgi:uncharacterized protein YecE (DUF72 family)
MSVLLRTVVNVTGIAGNRFKWYIHPMDFGKVDTATLGDIDFALPPDGRLTAALPAGVAPAKLYVGGAKWGRKEWLSIIYPKGTKEKDYVAHYVKHFNGIELNATHYQIWPQSVIAGWAAHAAGKDFKFCPKFPQLISHYGDLTSPKAHADTDKFLASVSAFGGHLGPAFLQLSERFGPQRKQALFAYLQSLPRDMKFLLEVRHPSWLEGSDSRELFDLLKQLGIGTVITDVSGRRDCLHMEVTAPFVMIRFVGNGMHPTDYVRLDAWVERMGEWMKKDIAEIHFYMHQPDELYTPQMTKYLVDSLNERLGLSIEPPHLIETTGGLFD